MDEFVLGMLGMSAGWEGSWFVDCGLQVCQSGKPNVFMGPFLIIQVVGVGCLFFQLYGQGVVKEVLWKIDLYCFQSIWKLVDVPLSIWVWGNTGVFLQ